MNERNPRRQPATRRRANQEAGHNTAAQTSRQANASSSQHHHHSSTENNYSHSNFRHPSTTTTSSSNPSTHTSTQSRDCALSICYSYLIAIFSSFLVVLGLYLSLTRFNVRYLYISLIGLSFEAIGACIYCVSNTRANKLTRRKQQANSNNAYILNSNSISSNNNNSNSGNISNPSNLNPILHISRPHPSGQQALDTSHLQDNRVLSSSETNHNDSALSHISDGPTLVRNRPSAGDSHAQPITRFEPSVPTLVEDLGGHNRSEGGSKAKKENSVVIINVQSEFHGEQDAAPAIDSGTAQEGSSAGQLPNNHSCQKSQDPSSSPQSVSSPQVESEGPSGGRQQNDLFETHQNDEAQAFTRTQDNVIPRSNQTGDNPTSNVDTSNGRASAAAGSESQLISIDNSRHSTSNSIDLIQLSFGNERGAGESSRDENLRADTSGVDLNSSTGHSGLVPSAPLEHQVVSRRSSAQSRSVNVRRTLVMGLSGEEELIEIDEDDLDNMSILPPSYESIAHNRS